MGLFDAAARRAAGPTTSGFEASGRKHRATLAPTHAISSAHVYFGHEHGFLRAFDFADRYMPSVMRGELSFIVVEQVAGLGHGRAYRWSCRISPFRFAADGIPSAGRPSDDLTEERNRATRSLAVNIDASAAAPVCCLHTGAQTSPSHGIT